MHALSKVLDEITQPTYPYYHLVQGVFFGTFSFLATSIFTSLPPTHGMAFTLAAYTVSQITSSLFGSTLEPYKQVSLVPLMGQAAHLLVSFATATLFCKIIQCPLSWADAGVQILFFLSAIALSRFALHKLRQNL